MNLLSSVFLWEFTWISSVHLGESINTSVFDRLCLLCKQSICSIYNDFGPSLCSIELLFPNRHRHHIHMRVHTHLYTDMYVVCTCMCLYLSVHMHECPCVILFFCCWMSFHYYHVTNSADFFRSCIVNMGWWYLHKLELNCEPRKDLDGEIFDEPFRMSFFYNSSYDELQFSSYLGCYARKLRYVF